MLPPGFASTFLFPATWTIAHQPIAVVGTGPSRRAAIVLELEGEGADPMAANALAPDARLAAGALVKAARREVYRRGR